MPTTRSITAATSAAKLKSGSNGMLRTQKRRLLPMRKAASEPVLPQTSLPHWLQPMSGLGTPMRGGARLAQQPLGQRLLSLLQTALRRAERYLQRHLGLLLCVWLLPSLLLLTSCANLTPPGVAQQGNPYSIISPELLRRPLPPVQLMPLPYLPSTLRTPAAVAPAGGNSTP